MTRESNARSGCGLLLYGFFEVEAKFFLWTGWVWIIALQFAFKLGWATTVGLLLVNYVVLVPVCDYCRGRLEVFSTVEYSVRKYIAWMSFKKRALFWREVIDWYDFAQHCYDILLGPIFLGVYVFGLWLRISPILILFMYWFVPICMYVILCILSCARLIFFCLVSNSLWRKKGRLLKQYPFAKDEDLFFEIEDLGNIQKIGLWTTLWKALKEDIDFWDKLGKFKEPLKKSDTSACFETKATVNYSDTNRDRPDHGQTSC